MVVACGWVVGQGPEDAPVRLKKKPKPETPTEEKEVPKTRLKVPEEEPREEPGMGEQAAPQESEKEILERIGKNMRRVEEQLVNRELTEGTLQTEDDIIKDLESLIKREEQNQANSDQNQASNSGSSSSQNQQNRNRQSSGRRTGRRPSGDQQARNNPMASGNQQNPMPGGNQQNPMPGGNQQNPMQGGNAGNNPGAGGDDPKRTEDPATDLYKDVWGHLPETVRSQMDAYANRQAYMAKYRDLIKEYYRSIAEQGQR
jgi:hypothetical protein